VKTLLRDRAPLALPDALLTAVVEAYAGADRAYHDVTHLLEVSEHFATVARGPGWRAPNESYLALLFHDAVYLAGAKDNEAQSAELARNALSAIACDRERVAALIMLTARHGRIDREELDEDARLFCDCDMAILGAAPERYDAYEAAIAREYALIPPPLFRAGRNAFLSALLASPRIFLSDFFCDRLDARARDNLRRAVRG
jgi:predicted metal-dependent HD superfamily phosphohydrolase